VRLAGIDFQAHRDLNDSDLNRQIEKLKAPT
jgi:hypothetical protein